MMQNAISGIRGNNSFHIKYVKKLSVGGLTKMTKRRTICLALPCLALPCLSRIASSTISYSENHITENII